MNAKMFLGGAVALSLAFAVGSASADDVQKYGATFESAVSATPGEMNDWAYALGTNVTTYANTAGESYGWFGAADDASTIVAANNGQALRVDTGSSILTNKLASSVTNEINSDSVLLDAGAYIEVDVKLTARNELGEGIPDGANAPKLALYSYCDSAATPCTTNLVVYHAYLDNGALVRTNEVFDTLVDAEACTKVRIVMKKIVDGGILRNVFSVALDDGEPLTSDLAFSDGIWFLSAEGAGTQGIASVCFSGSGEVDNVGMGILQSDPMPYTDPEGREIEVQALVDWLSANNFTQSDIDALGDDSAATDLLYACWRLNCSIKDENPGGKISITAFSVTNGVVSIAVQLARRLPLGSINGVLYFYGADDLAAGFGRSPISEEIIDFSDGSSSFDTEPVAGPLVQSVTATIDATYITWKFFKAVIEGYIPDSEEPGNGSEE